MLFLIAYSALEPCQCQWTTDVKCLLRKRLDELQMTSIHQVVRLAATPARSNGMMVINEDSVNAAEI